MKRKVLYSQQRPGAAPAGPTRRKSAFSQSFKIISADVVFDCANVCITVANCCMAFEGNSAVYCLALDHRRFKITGYMEEILSTLRSSFLLPSFFFSTPSSISLTCDVTGERSIRHFILASRVIGWASTRSLSTVCILQKFCFL